MKKILIATLFIAVVGVCSYAWFHYVLHPKPQTCAYCSRALHANVRVTAEIDGKRSEACCARCAITEANQLHKHLKLVTVHDYTTGNMLAPESAWFVEGSHAQTCEDSAMHMNEMKEMQDMAFDRCSPGTVAFANKASADAFVAQNGGTVLSFVELMREAHYQ